VQRLTTVVIWAAFGAAAVLATAPLWRLAVMGLSPSLDDALLLLCGPN
jgi:hypothetical protein